MRKILIFTLLMAIVLVAACVERETKQRVPSTDERELITVKEEDIFTVSTETSTGKLTAPFAVNMTLLGIPTLNKDVEVTIAANALTGEFPNSSIIFMIYDYIMYGKPPLVKNILWNGTIRQNETVQVKHIFRITEPGYFILVGGAGREGPGSNSVLLYLNVTEKSAKVNTVPFVLPPPPPRPDVPYIIKLDIQGVPKLNTVVDLKATIASLVDEKNTTFTIFLPEGFELVSGNLSWTEDLTASTSEEEIRGLMRVDRTFAEEIFNRINIPTTKRVSFSARIKAVKTGDWVIYALPTNLKPDAVECRVDAPVIIDYAKKQKYELTRSLDDWYISRAPVISGCINVRVLNDTAIVSGLPLPYTPPPGATPPPKDLEMPPSTVSPTQLPLSTTLPPQTTPPPPGTPPLPLNATPIG